MRQAIIAPQQDRFGDQRTSRVILAGLLLSLLLHALLVVLLLEKPWLNWLQSAEPAPLEITMVIPEAPKPAPVPPPPPQPQVQTPPAPPPPPEAPQLQRGRVAEESAAPPPKQEAPRQQSRPPPRLQTPPRSEPQTNAESLQQRPAARPSTPRQPMTREETTAAVRNAPEMVQTERDFFLSQIVDHMFIDFDAPQFERIQIYGAYVVMPDGMMAAPFDKTLPFDMSRMVDAETWRIMQQPNNSSLRVAMESFLRGMYLAQPLQLPADFGNRPKRMTLNFRIGDLR